MVVVPPTNSPPPLHSGILESEVDVPRPFLEDKYGRLARKERPLVLAALSFVKALLQKAPNDRLSNDQIPSHIFFQVRNAAAVVFNFR